MYVKVVSKGHAFIISLPWSPSNLIFFLLWVTLGLFLNLLSSPPPQLKIDVMQNPICFETDCFK